MSPWKACDIRFYHELRGGEVPRKGNTMSSPSADG
jgi:hypothetical protein